MEVKQRQQQQQEQQKGNYHHLKIQEKNTIQKELTYIEKKTQNRYFDINTEKEIGMHIFMSEAIRQTNRTKQGSL